MKLLSENFDLDSPHFSSIRRWVGRVGLYELYRKKTYRDDWIFIVDLTLELGQEKAMVVYGISQEKSQKILAQEQRALKHTVTAHRNKEVFLKSPKPNTSYFWSARQSQVRLNLSNSYQVRMNGIYRAAKMTKPKMLTRQGL